MSTQRDVCLSQRYVYSSQEDLIRGTAKLEQMNWSDILGTLLLQRLYIYIYLHSKFRGMPLLQGMNIQGVPKNPKLLKMIYC